MTDLDELLALAPIEPPSLAGKPTERKCRRHEWLRIGFKPFTGLDGATTCVRCGVVKDEARSRRGKSASRQGKDAERQIAAQTGGKRVGHLGGPVDVLSPTPRRFAIQSKRVTAPSAARGSVARRASFPEWLWDELRKLPVTGGDVPALIVSDKPGPGKQRRSLVIVDYRDYVELYGEPE